MPFNSENDSEVIVHSAAMVKAFTPEMYAYLLSLFPTPGGYAELHNRYEAGYPGALRGNPDQVKAFEADRKAVITDLSLILGLAKMVAVKDPTVPETLGVVHATAKTSPVTLGIPRDFKIFYDPNGQQFASVARVPGAKGYQVWVCDSDPSIEANWRLIASSPNCKRIAIVGLNRAKFNVLRIRAMRGHDAGPWSNWVSLETT